MTEPKRFKHEFLTLEYLPNELFVEIFGYLKGVDAVYAFSQLNRRLQNLLNDYVKHFNFNSVSKAKLELIARLHDIHQWRSLCLSNDDHTPGQITYFCQLFPPAQSMSRLQSLAVLNMTSTYAQEFLLQLGSFNNLSSLSIGTVCGNTILSIELPLLKRLVLTSCTHTSWLMNFPCLESLQYTIEYNCKHTPYLIFPITLTRLKVFYAETRDGSILRNSLRKLSQLTTLALYDNGKYNSLPNGQIWEELIVSSLPLLHTFQFYFPFETYRQDSNDLTGTIDSFSTPFYLIEKRWFIRCDRDPNSFFLGAIYSLPFAFPHFPINTTSFHTSLSTLPDTDLDETKNKYYRKVKTLIFNQECLIPHLGFVESNIDQIILMVNLPINWLCFLKRLRSISISHYVDMSSNHFANILQHSTNLQSLTISSNQLKKLTDKFTHEIVCQQLSEKIQSLIISHQPFDSPRLDIVSVRLLSSIVRIFSKKCQHLSIALVAQPNTVRSLLQRMRQLRSLHIEWRYFILGSTDSATTSWIQNMSTDLTTVDFIHDIDKRHFFVWFGNRL